MDRENQIKAWSELAKFGVCSEGEFTSVSDVSIEEALGDALFAARGDARLFVAARNLFCLRYGDLKIGKIAKRIEAMVLNDDQEAALRCLEGLRRKAGWVTDQSLEKKPMTYFFALPKPRNPDPTMLASGLIIQSFSTEPVWRYLEPRLLKAR